MTMKSIVIAALAVSVVACSSDDNKKIKDPIAPVVGGSCSTTGATACDGTTVLSCSSTGIWEAGINCANSGQVCEDRGNSIFDCVSSSVAKQFDSCDGGGRCDTGLECRDSFNGELCVADCTASACAAGTYCDENGFSAPSCWVQVGRGEGCISDDGCSEGECLPTSVIVEIGGEFYPATECNITCGYGDIGTSTGCGSNETCLDSGFSDPQLDMSDATIDCTTNGNGDCDDTQGYTCRSFADGSFCARTAASCAFEVAITTDFTEANVDSDDFEDYCGDTFSLCAGGGTGANDAPVQCSEFGNGIWVYGDATSASGYVQCTETADCLQFPITDDAGDVVWGTAECIETSGGDSLCARRQMLCAAFCDDPDGGADLTCPMGQTCGSPATLIGAWIGEESSTTTSGYVDCTAGSNAGCDVVGGYECVEFSDGALCARKRRVCTATN